MAAPDSQRWQDQLAARFRAHFALKFVGISAAIAAFMAVYFTLLHHPQFPVTVVPLLALDHVIAFVPWAVVPYVTLWIYIGLVPGLLYPGAEMLRFTAAAVVVAVIGCGIFFFFPTAVPASSIDWSRWPLLAALKSADQAGNACPSLHVAYSVLSAAWLASLLRRIGAPAWLHAVNVAWCILIIWSTVAIRQHVMLDVEAGIVLGGGVALAHLVAWPAWRRRRLRATC